MCDSWFTVFGGVTRSIGLWGESGLRLVSLLLYMFIPQPKEYRTLRENLSLYNLISVWFLSCCYLEYRTLRENLY
jgi:hypothetical protein